MVRRVNRKILDHWIHNNGPDGISKLAVKSQVAADTIKRSRASNVAPKKPITQQLIAEAIGVEVNELFPAVAPKGKAS
jgi:lambda repressor-like predicted transcriptional regulator